MRLDRALIPQTTIDEVMRYKNDHTLPGGFLLEVLKNDLHGAVTRADMDNLRALREITMLVWDELPQTAHGSTTKVAEWIKQGVITNREF